MKTRLSLLMAFCVLPSLARADASESVTRVRLPDGGIQPRVLMEPNGDTQVVFFKGTPGGGDLWHTILKRDGASLSAPVLINSTPKSAVATGTIRGAQLALGMGGRAHVIWNGSLSRKGDRPPLFYTRTNDHGSGFEEQRALSGDWIMDGGGAVAADGKGSVLVFYHGGQGHGEASRRVLIRISRDDGKTFEAERVISPPELGVCPCCGMQVLADGEGRVFVIYRASSDEGRRRDITTLFSKDSGRTWRHAMVDRWEINACPMSSMSVAAEGKTVAMSWEREGQVYLGRWDNEAEKMGDIQPLPGAAQGRKHPSLCADAAGNWLVTWTEDTGWNKGGSMAWQLLDAAMKPMGMTGHAPGVPVWSFVSAARARDGGFMIWH